MLTLGQKDYLSKLDSARANSSVQIKPYDPHTRIVAQKVIKIIKEKIPDADVRFMGASALGIAGQNDIDLYVICVDAQNKQYTSILRNIFGEKIKNKWHWFEDGYEISVYLSDPNEKKFKEQLDIFAAFQNNPIILKEYEKLKISMDGATYRDYQIVKYEFYNRVLGINQNPS